MKQTSFSQRGFTLIELLIVVAIIAILAAIAVPNFLEAQVRSKVSRAKADMRSMATGLEAYRVDNNAYPKCNNYGLLGARFDPNEQGMPDRLVLERLSTPVAYMTSAFIMDPFISQQRTGTINSTDGSFTPSPTTVDPNRQLTRYLQYFTPGFGGLQDVEAPAERAKWFFVLASAGPDLIYPNPGGIFATATLDRAVCNNIYDPTNGTTSRGDVYRIGGTTTGMGNYGAMFFKVVSEAQR
jgi:type II secretion system protein G